MKQPAIEIIKVSKQFGPAYAVQDISLDIYPGEFLSLLGPSGCGKTTLLRLIAGFESLGSGQIVVSGQDMSGIPPHRRPVNMVFQNYALFPHLCVFENVAFGLRCAGLTDSRQLRQQVGEALNLVRLSALGDRFPAQLSGGQQQRVALARAIVNRPSVLLLDEPLAALDLQIRQQMQEELAALQQQLAMTFVMVTHDQGEALALSHRVAVFHQGRLEQLGAPSEIYGAPQTAFVADFIGQANLLAAVVSQRQEPYLCVTADTGLKLWVKDNPGCNGAAVKVWVRPEALRLKESPDHAAAAGCPSGPVNSFEAVVTQRSYQGTTILYRLLSGGQLIWRACIPSREALWTVGQTVNVSFDACEASVFPAAASLPDGDAWPPLVNPSSPASSGVKPVV